MDARGRDRAITDLPPEGFDGHWTTARKEAVVLAFEEGRLELNHLLRVYYLTFEEFEGWRRKFRKDGRGGLKATKVQPPSQRNLPGLG